jgi:hypothetical protein
MQALYAEEAAEEHVQHLTGAFSGEHEHDVAAAAAAAARQKIARNWARLGFQQASFGSEFWYLLPSRLCFKSKQEVAGVPVTEMPKRPAVAAKDKPLLDYLLGCKADGPPSTFEADVRHHIQQGADLERMHVLHRAFECGINSELHYRVLVGLGADPNGVDWLGRSALHQAHHLIRQNHSALTSGIEAVHSLLKCGGDSRGCTDVGGKTPLDSLLAKRHFREAFEGLRRRSSNRCVEERLECELLRLLLTPAQRAVLSADVLTPRQSMRFRFFAGMSMDEIQLSVPQFENQEPVSADTLSDLDLPYWDDIPEHVRGTESNPSFVYGHAEVVVAMCSVILSDSSSGAVSLPTPAAVMRQLQMSHSLGGCDNRNVDFYFRQGGKVDFTIDGMLYEVRFSEHFFEVLPDEDPELINEYLATPEHPLDEEWSFVRTMILEQSS